MYLFWDDVWQLGGYHPDHAEGWHVHDAPEPLDEVQCWPRDPEHTALGEPERICIGFGPDDWRVLLVLEPLEDLDQEWLGERLFLLVEADRVRAGDFSRAWVTLCSDDA